MRLLVLQAYGSPRILQEARFAVLTFLHFAMARQDGWKVVVYTDHPDVFADLGAGVVTEPMGPGRVRAWRGAWGREGARGRGKPGDGGEGRQTRLGQR